MATFMVRITKCVKARIWVPITKQKIACCALLLASSTFYYQFLRTSHDFKGLVVDYMQDISGGRSARVVLMNNGTYYETLCDASLIYSCSKDFSDFMFVSGHNVDDPVVLRPGERMVCLVKDQSTPEKVLHVIGRSLKPLQGNMTILTKLDEEGKLPFRLYYGVLFEVVGSSGKVHKTSCLAGVTEVTKKHGPFFYSDVANHTYDLLKETVAPGATAIELFREN